MSDLPTLPVAELLDQLIGDSSSDFADGDHPGYFRHTYNAETGTLHVFYEHGRDDEVDDNDEEFLEPTHAEAAYRFQLVSEVSGEPGDFARQVKDRYLNERNDYEDHLPAIRNVLRDAVQDREATDTELGAIARVLLAIEDD